jgi:hypothetical protein
MSVLRMSGVAAGAAITLAGITAPIAVYTINSGNNPYRVCPGQSADCVTFTK